MEPFGFERREAAAQGGAPVLSGEVLRPLPRPLALVGGGGRGVGGGWWAVGGGRWAVGGGRWVVGGWWVVGVGVVVVVVGVGVERLAKPIMPEKNHKPETNQHTGAVFFPSPPLSTKPWGRNSW